MTIDQVILYAQSLGIVIFYGIVALGPGVATGIILGNRLAARDRETLMQKHETSLRKADEHNSQWDPAHQRWQK